MQQLKSDNELQQLDDAPNFIARHIGPSPEEQQQMLKLLGYNSLTAMVRAALPSNIIELECHDALPKAQSEAEILQTMARLAGQNKQLTSMIGQGFYNCHCPQVLLRNVFENPGWYSSYTPYQAEISQGRLEALANYQTMVASLCGLDIANASLLDEASACAEAMSLCARVNKKSQRFFISKHCHPQNIDVVRNRGQHAGIEVLVGDENMGLPEGICAALFSYPNSLGRLCDYSELIAKVQQQGALVVLSCDLLALSILSSPGDLGADIAVGSSQRFGTPLGFGGPHAAFMAVRKKLHRSLPGRIIGRSVDRLQQPSYRMALQTREQHIRRQKATSNICTAQALLAVMAGFYASYHGVDGLQKIARRCNLMARSLAAGLQQLGFELQSEYFFDTITISTKNNSAFYLEKALLAGYNLRRVDDDLIAISCDETTSSSDVQALLESFAANQEEFSYPVLSSSIPEALQRQSKFMEQPIFHRYHSETEMMRYLRHLVNRDLALDRSMIPLGSCTMKLNSATIMAPLSLSGFANLHPFIPANQAAGYHKLFEQLEEWLAIITGYDAVSLQPNAGSQGEYAGLLAIKAWHSAQGQGQRDICLIPVSAHGTNPASAQMLGMQVVTVACNASGDVDLDSLAAKCEQHSDKLAALMITYPSTHGVFEAEISKICQLVHQAGGQVYIDGANLNAQVGLAYPGHYGGDVSHLNLHKTFCIPHGGGGPGVGAIAVKEHLRPYLPGHSVVDNGCGVAGATCASPWGSASILTISYAYIALMGSNGLQRASMVAVLAANYLANRLAPYYPILYTGANNLVAHEFIIDIRPLEKSCAVSSEDVAKRLIDYGFHAPTLSFPVPGTLMIEPTESESLSELERFVEAMIAIRAEIEEIDNGSADAQNNLLKNAPHPAVEAINDNWPHPYSRERAIYPLASLRGNKFWPVVARVDNAYGDRNFLSEAASS